jgi:hypothetical protein
MSAKSVESSFTVKSKSWLHGLQFLDSAEFPIASIGGGIFSLGTRKFTFPENSPHSSHNIEMRPVAINSAEEAFVKDSVLYFWECDSAKKRTLTKVVSGSRIEIGKYETKHERTKEGILVLDSSQLNDVVAVLSCIALLNQVDSFVLPK